VVAIPRNARQKLAGIGGGEHPHRTVAHALRQLGIERHQLVMEFGRVLVDRGEQRRVRGKPGTAASM